MLLQPQLEGRNVGQDLVTIYFKDPFLAFVYVGSIPFFIALYQGINLLGYVEKNKAFSLESVRALRNIKYCAIALIAFILSALAIIVFVVKGDDYAGPVALGLYASFATTVVATAAAVFEKLLQNAVDLKSENDLTV